MPQMVISGKRFNQGHTNVRKAVRLVYGSLIVASAVWLLVSASPERSRNAARDSFRWNLLMPLALYAVGMVLLLADRALVLRNWWTNVPRLTQQRPRTLGLDLLRATWRCFAVLLLILSICAAPFLAIIWGWLPAKMEREYRDMNTQQTLLWVGLAAIKYEHCIGRAPAGLDDLVRAGLVVPAAEHRRWEVTDLASIDGEIARSLESCMDGSACGRDASPPDFVRLDAASSDTPVRRQQARLADARERLRAGRALDDSGLEQWLKDCGELRMGGSTVESGSPESSPAPP
jgi:hypothetical protein